METPSTHTSPNGHRFIFDDFEVDAANRLLLRNGVEIRLTAKVFDILLVFIENPGRLLEKNELVEKVWREEFVEEGNLARNVSTLRKALGDTGREHKYITTVQGRGYRFIAELKEGSERKTSEPDNRVADRNDSLTYKSTTTPTALTRKRLLLWTMVGLIVVTAGLSAFQLRSVSESSKKFLRFENVRLTKLTQSGDVYAPQISRDGQYIAYISLTDGAYGISVRQIATGTVLRLLPNKPRIAIWALAIAPDNSFLYYIMRNEDSERAKLYRMPLLGGSPFKVAEFADGGLTIAPDGKQVAFVRVDRSTRRSSIIIVNNDGTNEKTFSSLEFESMYFSLDWSPDGKSFAASIKRSDSGHEYWYVTELLLDGGPERSIGERRDFRIIRAQWLPDKTGLIENAVDADSKQPQIYLLSYPNGLRQRITNDLNYYQGISISADGRALVATQFESSRQVWKIQGGNPEQLTQLTTGPQKHFDAIGWAGEEFLVFDQDESSSLNNYNIWRMRADGSDKQQLTFGNGNNSDPAVSADGNYIVFVSNRTGKAELWRMDINGGRLLQLTNIDYQPSLPQFTPDGQSILFLASVGGRFPLWKVSSEGGQAVQILDEDIYHWAISPDGNRVAYSTFDKEAHKVRTRIHSLVTNHTEQVLDIVPETWMRWSNDGESIYFNTRDDGAKNIWQLNLKTGKFRPFTKFSDQQVFRFYLSPIDNVLACIRQTGTFDAVLMRSE